MCCSQKPQKSQFPLWLHYPLSWCPQMEKYPGFAVYQLFVSLWEKPQNLLGRERGGHTWEGLKLSPQKERNCKTKGLDLGIPSPNCCSPVQLSRLSRAEKSRKRCSDAPEGEMKNSLSTGDASLIKKWRCWMCCANLNIPEHSQESRKKRKRSPGKVRICPSLTFPSTLPTLISPSSPFPPCHGPTAPRTNLVPQQKMLFIHFHYICASLLLSSLFLVLSCFSSRAGR